MYRFNFDKTFFLSFFAFLKSNSNLRIAESAAVVSCATFILPKLLSSMDLIRCLIASTNCLNRLGFSIKSSCRYGFLVTTHKSPKTSKSILADLPVFLLALSSSIINQISSPRKRNTISLSEKEV